MGVPTCFLRLLGPANEVEEFDAVVRLARANIALWLSWEGCSVLNSCHCATEYRLYLNLIINT